VDDVLAEVSDYASTWAGEGPFPFGELMRQTLAQRGIGKAQGSTLPCIDDEPTVCSPADGRFLGRTGSVHMAIASLFRIDPVESLRGLAMTVAAVLHAYRLPLTGFDAIFADCEGRLVDYANLEAAVRTPEASASRT